MTIGGPKPPVRNPTLPGVGAKPLTSPQVKTGQALPPKAPASSPSAIADAAAQQGAMSREEIRGVAHAIARAEAAVFREELAARLAKVEERLAALERKPVTPPPLPVSVPAAPITAPLPTFAPAVTPPPLPVAVAVAAPVAVAPVAVAAPVAPAPVIVAAPAPTFDISVDVDLDHPFASSARRRRRFGIFLITLLVLAVGGIVTAAMISQAMNNHSGH